MDKKKVLFFDTTLRDGEQTPGVSLSAGDKLRIAQQLTNLGVDIIEAGFPASSKGDFKATQRIAQSIKGPVIAALSRTLKDDIISAWEAVKEAERPRLHVFIATSDIHMKYKLKKTREEVLEMIKDSVSFAKSLCNDVQFSAEDGARSDIDFLLQAYRTAIDAGAGTINIVDTVGYLLPHEFGALVNKITSAFGNEPITFGAHCHNDLGLAAANTIQAIRNGVTQIDVTVNGIGERAGNASLEELAMALELRGQELSVFHNLKTEEIMRTSRLVAAVSGINIPSIKPIIGKNTFSHESGIHQHGVLNNAVTYEIFTPNKIGLSDSTLVLGKLSGRHAFSEKAVELGYHLDDTLLDAAFISFKEIADSRKKVTEADVRAIIESVISDSIITDGYYLDTFQIQSGNKIKAMAMISLSKKTETFEEAATGSGPIEAAFNAVNRIVQHEYKLEAYSIKAVTEGRDALGEVNVRISDDNGDYSGRGVSRDIIKASIKAYVNAINRASLHLQNEINS